MPVQAKPTLFRNHDNKKWRFSSVVIATIIALLIVTIVSYYSQNFDQGVAQQLMKKTIEDTASYNNAKTKIGTRPERRGKVMDAPETNTRQEALVATGQTRGQVTEVRDPKEKQIDEDLPSINDSPMASEFQPKAQQVVSEACRATLEYCGPDGSACGPLTTWSSVSHHERLRKLLLAPSNSTVQGVVIGNSVARTGNFRTTRLFREALERAGVQLTLSYGQVKGGFELRHLISSCGGLANQLKDVKLVIVQFSHHVAHELERAIRMILPLDVTVILISHCLMGDVWARPDWKSHRDHFKIGEPDGWWDEIREGERRLAHYYGLPLVSTCPAIHGMFNRSAHDAYKPLTSAQDLLTTFIPDCVHYNELGSALQACFLSRLLLDETAAASTKESSSAGKLPPPLTKPENPDDPDANAVNNFCYRTTEKNNDLSPHSHRGWERKVGGKGGRKVWWAATGGLGNSTLIISTTASAQFLKLMVYVHPDLPLGRAMVTVTPNVPEAASFPPSFIDPCCAGDHCEGTGPGRGWYKEFRIPEEGYFNVPSTVNELLIQVDIVSRDQATQCSQGEGAQFSLVGIAGLSL